LKPLVQRMYSYRFVLQMFHHRGAFVSGIDDGWTPNTDRACSWNGTQEEKKNDVSPSRVIQSRTSVSLSPLIHSTGNSFLFPVRAAIQMHSNNMFRQSKQEHVSVAHELHPMIQIPITNAKHADASPSLGRMLIILGGDGDWSEP
jgi:hypothetical protein